MKTKRVAHKYHHRVRATNCSQQTIEPEIYCIVSCLRYASAVRSDQKEQAAFSASENTENRKVHHHHHHHRTIRI